MVDVNLKQYIENVIKGRYDEGGYGGHGWEHITDVINRSFELMAIFNLNLNPNIVYVVAAYHDIGYSVDPDNHEQVSSEMFLRDKNIHKFFNEEEIKIIAEAIVDHRASLEYEPRSDYGKLVSSADRAIDVNCMLRRSIAFQAEKHMSENPTIEAVIGYSFKKLFSKYGSGGYAKMYYPDDKYKKYLLEMENLFSNRDEFYRAEFELIQRDESLQRYFPSEFRGKSYSFTSDSQL